MAINNFIPEIWSAAVAQALQEAAVLAPITNRQYEGEARRGNAVNVTGVVPPNITDYASAGRTTSAEDLSDDGDKVEIDQEKSFDFHVDDIDQVQAAGSFEAWTTAAGRALANDADSHIASQLVSGGTTLTTDITDIGGESNPGNAAHTVLRDARKALNLKNVPGGMRFFVMNAEFEAHLLEAEAKLMAVDTSGSPAGFREAVLGRYMGFTLVTSNLLPEQDEPQGIAFWQPAVAYISQIDKVEGLRSHNKFADRVRGLHVYGAKVLDVDEYKHAVQVYTEDNESSPSS